MSCYLYESHNYDPRFTGKGTEAQMGGTCSHLKDSCRNQLALCACIHSHVHGESPTWSHLVPLGPMLMWRLPLSPMFLVSLPHGPIWSQAHEESPTWSHAHVESPTWSHSHVESPTWAHAHAASPIWSHAHAGAAGVWLCVSDYQGCAVTRQWHPDTGGKVCTGPGRMAYFQIIVINVPQILN